MKIQNRIIEYPVLIVIHEDQVWLLAPRKTTQNSNPVFESIAQTLLQLWQAWEYVHCPGDHVPVLILRLVMNLFLLSTFTLPRCRSMHNVPSGSLAVIAKKILASGRAWPEQSQKVKRGLCSDASCSALTLYIRLPLAAFSTFLQTPAAWSRSQESILKGKATIHI